jgi:predicted transposase/invertase (TIGR01784 family)
MRCYPAASLVEYNRRRREVNQGCGGDGRPDDNPARMGAAMKTDALFYQLFQDLPDCYFELIGAPAELAEGYTFASEELKQAGMRCDGVFLPSQADKPVHFVEVFFYKTAHAYSNLFSKVFLWLETRNPAQDWHACIVFGSRRLEPLPRHPYRALLASEQVTRIFLDELPEPAEHQLGLGIVDLIASPASEALPKARRWLDRIRILRQPVAVRRKAVELIETVVLGHFPRLSRKELEKMLEIKDFRETKIYREALEEGLEKGREQERAEIAARLLARQFSPAEVARLTGLSVQRVRSLRKKNGKQ